jgi:hypothetical protein
VGLIPVTLLVGTVLVVVSRGSFQRLAALRFGRGWLLFVGLGLQIALTLVHLPRARWGDVGFATLVLSYALLLTFSAANLRHRAMAIIALGMALNATCIVVNHGMPYRPARGSALRASVKNRPERPDDRLMFLADVIVTPQPIPGYNSIGDFVICAGLLVTMVVGSHTGQRAARREPSEQTSGPPGGPDPQHEQEAGEL